MDNNNNKLQLGFIHRFIPPSSNKSELRARQGEQAGQKKTRYTTFLLLHGTGGNEEDLMPLANELDQRAAILSPRGKVLENGIAPRFFRRLAEGVFDIEDLKFRTNELSNFVKNASNTYGFDLQHTIAVGYCNGEHTSTTNIARS